MTLGCVRDDGPTCGYTTTKEANFGEIGLGVDFGDRSFITDGVLAERGCAEEMVDGLPIGSSGESGCFLVCGHESIAPVVHQRLTDVGLAAFALGALLAFAHPYRNHFVSRLQILDVTPHALHQSEAKKIP